MCKNLLFSQREKGILLLESINIEYLIIQWLRPVLRYKNPQNMRDYDDTQVQGKGKGLKL